MYRARKAKHLTQEQVGARVGTSQNIISLIESGDVESSSYILPICKYLGIAPPQHHASEDQRQWSRLGHMLAVQSPRQFARALALVQSMIEESVEAEGEVETDE